jgi:hypothetical protein
VVNRIAVYVEGGGPRSATRRPFRDGMCTFLGSVLSEVRRRRIGWQVIPCGGRKQAYDAFVDALEKEREVFNVLLVDSEDPVTITVPPWDYLKQREGDKWDKPAGADDTRCQMMVACMEAWFLADPDGLMAHYGSHFDTRKLPAPNLAESRTKAEISDALQKATRNTKAKEYQKIRDGAKLLEKVDPIKVRQHCKWCERLFKELRDAIGATV